MLDGVRKQRTDMGPLKYNVTIFSLNFTHPLHRNANGVELLIFVTLVFMKSALRNA